MILYVNGDSHAAAAEAATPFAFAYDDPELLTMGRLPHPDNLKVSWGKKLAELLKYSFHCGAESAASNARIIRTTKEWVSNTKVEHKDILIVIGWSTWEREEWLIRDEYFQLGASGIDSVPDDYKQKYKEFVANINWKEKTLEAHQNAIELHKWLNERQIKHVFFNCNNTFEKINTRYDWGNSYIDPYSLTHTYDAILREQGFTPITSDSWHFGDDAHSAWSKYLLRYINDNEILGKVTKKLSGFNRSTRNS